MAESSEAWGTPRRIERISEVLDALHEAWKRPGNEDQRLGQLLINTVLHDRGDLSPEQIERTLWNLDDDELLALLRGADRTGS